MLYVLVQLLTTALGFYASYNICGLGPRWWWIRWFLIALAFLLVWFVGFAAWAYIFTDDSTSSDVILGGLSFPFISTVFGFCCGVWYSNQTKSGVAPTVLNEFSVIPRMKETPKVDKKILLIAISSFAAGMIIATLYSEISSPRTRDECLLAGLKNMQTELATRAYVGACTRNFPN